MFQGVCAIFMVMSWFDKKTEEGGGGRGPNRPRGRANGEQDTYIEKIEIRERTRIFSPPHGFPRVLGFDSKAVQRSALCRSRRELSNEYLVVTKLLAKFGFDTAEPAHTRTYHALTCAS